MDLSKLSDADLQALQSGGLSGVSDDGLRLLSGGSASSANSTPTPRIPRGAVQDPATGAYAMPSLHGPKLDILSALATGAGKKVSDIGAGVRQLFGFASGGNKELDAEQRFKQAAYKPLSNERPVAMAIGEMLPEAALAATLPAGSLMGAAASGAFAGALPGALSYTHDTPDFLDSVASRAKTAAAEGVMGGLGGAAGYGLTRLIQPVSGSAPRASGDAMDAANRVGYRPTPAERTGSPLLRNIENYFERTPGVSGRFQDLRTANQTAINRAASRAMGENADEIGAGVFSAAEKRLGAAFDDINSKAAPDLTNSRLLQTLMKLDTDNAARSSFRVPEVDDLVNRGLDLASQGKLTGAAYQSIRSDLGARVATATNSTVKDALKAIQTALDDAANASLPADEQAALALARKQYGAFKTLMSGKVVEDGNVIPSRVASALPQRGNRTAYKTGRLNSDLMDIARIGEAFKPPANPNSGSLLLTQGFAGSPLRGAAYGIANQIPGRMYLNPAMQRYLENNVLPNVIEQGLIRSGAPAGLVGLGAIQSN